MPQLLWDASALVKRYGEERGTETVEALFASRPSPAMLTTYMGYAETAAILRRNLNRGDIDRPAFLRAVRLLQNDVLLDPHFELVSINDTDVLAGMALTDRHNINSTDAAILAAYLRCAQAQSSCLLVAADRRRLRAASTEGLPALNPETLPAADVPALLARS